jgi:hypothetical protein
MRPPDGAKARKMKPSIPGGLHRSEPGSHPREDSPEILSWGLGGEGGQMSTVTQDASWPGVGLEFRLPGSSEKHRLFSPIQVQKCPRLGGWGVQGRYRHHLSCCRNDGQGCHAGCAGTGMPS